jgi:hypothetical protein
MVKRKQPLPALTTTKSRQTSRCERGDHRERDTDLSREPGLSGTTSLAVAGMTTLPLGLQCTASTSTRVYLLRLPDNKPILDQLPDVLPAVCHGDFIDLIRVQPHLPFPTLEDTGCQPLLQLEGHHGVLPSVTRPPSVFLLPSRPLVRSVRSAASPKAKRRRGDAQTITLTTTPTELHQTLKSGLRRLWSWPSLLSCFVMRVMAR